LRVLFSAYACEPNRGGEPEVGWQRALHMGALVDEVWVLTRSNNRSVIEAAPSSHSKGLHFIYYDVPQWILRHKKKAWFFPVYLTLWQWGAYRLALRLHRVKPFDRVYHVTFSGTQAGSFMGRLGIPFVIGPIGGGERAPFRLRHGMPVLCRAKELLRDLRIVLERYNPLSRSALAAAEHIYVTTPDSLRLVAPKWHSKTEVQLSIAACARTAKWTVRPRSESPRFVYLGRLLYWKGVHLAIRALAEARVKVPASTLTLIGGGPEERWLRNLASRLGVEDAVEFVGYVPSRQQVMDSLHTYTALVFPSLHDSGGMVVLEALAAGLPVICLDLGGPGVIVNRSCGVAVSTDQADEARTVTRIADAMIRLGSMSNAELDCLSKGAVARADELSWARLSKCIAHGEGQ
jgi:glycosyltransferase involved in cell wall biosynthesis